MTRHAWLAEPLGRARFYGALRWGFLPADDRSWAVLSSSRFEEELRAGAGAAGIDAAAVLGEFRACLPGLRDAPGLEAAYHRTLGPPASCSPYEADYTSTSPFMMARELADIAGFYRAFGCEASPGAAERVDHVGVELEFLALLALREHQAGRMEDASLVADAQARFLEAHAARWLPAFAERLTLARGHAVFRSLGSLAARAVHVDAEARGLAPPPLPDAARRLAPLQDAPECGGCPISGVPLPNNPPAQGAGGDAAAR